METSREFKSSFRTYGEYSAYEHRQYIYAMANIYKAAKVTRSFKINDNVRGTVYLYLKRHVGYQTWRFHDAAKDLICMHQLNVYGFKSLPVEVFAPGPIKHPFDLMMLIVRGDKNKDRPNKWARACNRLLVPHLFQVYNPYYKKVNNAYYRLYHRYSPSYMEYQKKAGL